MIQGWTPVPPDQIVAQVGFQFIPPQLQLTETDLATHEVALGQLLAMDDTLQAQYNDLAAKNVALIAELDQQIQLLSQQLANVGNHQATLQNQNAQLTNDLGLVNTNNARLIEANNKLISDLQAELNAANQS